MTRPLYPEVAATAALPARTRADRMRRALASRPDLPQDTRVLSDRVPPHEGQAARLRAAIDSWVAQEGERPFAAHDLYPWLKGPDGGWLLNHKRVGAGISALVTDGVIVAVGRTHSRSAGNGHHEVSTYRLAR